MAYPNGQIPSHMLKSLPGNNAGLLKPYAYSYWAWHYYSIKHGGPSLAIYDGQVGRTYRPYLRQVLAKRLFGSNAATPGTSNHGLGKAVDLMTQAQRAASDRFGAQFGWLKAWSDASWEWWHLRGVKEMGPVAKPDPLRKLGKRRRAASRLLLYRRRERRREARTGKGPRYRRLDRAVSRSYRKVVAMWRRAKPGPQRDVLAAVLKDRDGKL